MNSRPDPSGASDIHSVRFSASAGKIGRISILGKGAEESGSTTTPRTQSVSNLINKRLIMAAKSAKTKTPK